MDQNEFNELVADEIATLRNENKALKKQLKAMDGAEELLAKLTIATDSAQSLHNVMMTEKKQAAEQSLQHRKEIKDEIEAAFARLDNSKRLSTSQVQLVYDAKAEADQALEEIRNLHQSMEQMGSSLNERQNKVIENIDSRYENFDRMAGNEYLAELHRNDANRRSNEEITREVERQLRVMLRDPSGTNPPESTDEAQ